MEELKKKKHDHKPTKILKFLIFMFVMFAPFFSVLSKCLYVVCNDNAKESYATTINPKYESNEVNSLNDLKIGNLYTITIEQSDIPTGLTTWVKIKNAYNIPYQNSIKTNVVSDNINTYFYLRANANGTLTITNGSYQSITTVQTQDNSYPYIFQIEYMEILNNSLTYNHFSYTDFNIYENKYNAEQTLDNVFEYAVNQLQDNNLYNWSKQTGIYTAIYNMTEGLGANETLAMLLAYWGILTAIYIVFDIVIELFIKLTHMFSE